MSFGTALKLIAITFHLTRTHGSCCSSPDLSIFLLAAPTARELRPQTIRGTQTFYTHPQKWKCNIFPQLLLLLALCCCWYCCCCCWRWRWRWLIREEEKKKRIFNSSGACARERLYQKPRLWNSHNKWSRRMRFQHCGGAGGVGGGAALWFLCVCFGYICYMAFAAGQ